MSTTTLRRDLNPISASVLSVVSWFCATSVDLSSAQLYSTRSSVDPLLGAKLPTNEESMFRLPNQSSLCERFIHTYHLQSPSTNADYLKLPFLEIHPFSAWNDAHQTKSPRPLPGDPTSSIKSASTDRIHGTLGFGNYFDAPSKDKGTRFYTFTSPAYPHNYPPDIDCIKIIRAPSEETRIVLDFRGPFLMEPSTGCTNDYLEVRDGQFGFSSTIGRFCADTRHLRPIVSTGRWLWLRFHSDFSIEKPGFQAVFHYDNQPPATEEPSARLKPLTFEAIITVQTGGVFNSDNLSQIVHNQVHRLDFPETTKRIGNWWETLIDFRTVAPNMPLLLHLSFVKFPLNDPNCLYNTAEIYDRFFLSDRSDIPRLLKRPTRKLPDTHPLAPRVVRACNQPSLNPVLHGAGRGIVRILSSSPKMLLDANDMNGVAIAETNVMTAEDMDKYLPEVTLAYTALAKAPCKPGWLPCMSLDDVNKYYDRLNRTGLSLVDVLLLKSEQDEPVVYTREQLTGLQLDSIFCVPASFICDTAVNCPQGEDENECPRPSGRLDRLTKPTLESDSMTDEEHDGDGRTPTTEAVAQVDKKSSQEEQAEENEFPHHTSIIVGLLGFCAICGLLSAGMTIVKRSKAMKKRNLSDLCNILLFESRASLTTTLEPSSVLHLQVTAEPMKDASNNIDAVDLTKDTWANTVDVPRTQCTEKQEGSRCFSSCSASNNSESVKARSSFERSRNEKSDNGNEHQSVDDDLESAPYKDSDENAEHSTDSAAFVKQLTASPSSRAARSKRSSVSSVHQYPATVIRDGRKSIPLGPTRSAACSFSHLPNTIILPVEKLSDVVYHCNENFSNTHQRPSWNQSGPIPLVTTSNDWPQQRVVYGAHSAKCVSRTCLTDKSDLNPCDAFRLGSHQADTFWGDTCGLTTDFRQAYDAELDHRPWYLEMSNDGTSYDQYGESARKRHFKGVAAKRARYSIEPSHLPPTSTNKAYCKATNGIPASFIQPDSGHSRKRAMQWTHSRFDDGETVDPISSEVRVSARTPQTGMEPLHDVTESMLDSRYRVDSRQVRPDRHSQSDTEVEVTTSEFVDAQIAEGGPLMPLNCTQFDEAPWIQTDDVNYPTLRVDDNWASYYHPSTISTIVYEPQRISIPCSCVIRDTKLAFPSKLSMVDASRISHGHSHARNRNTSMENVRWEQYETELERSGRNSDETGETGSLTEGSAEDRKNTPYDVEPHATFDYGAKREDIPGNQRPLSLVDKSCAISDAKTENSGSRDTERSFYSEVL